jgi:hypothetical protein
MSAVPPKAEVNLGHQRYRALEIIAGTLAGRAIDFTGARRTFLGLVRIRHRPDLLDYSYKQLLVESNEESSNNKNNSPKDKATSI